MKNIYLFLLFNLVCVSIFAQEPGKAGELLSNEISTNKTATIQNIKPTKKQEVTTTTIFIVGITPAEIQRYSLEFLKEKDSL